jgi:hypothetical protein
MVQQPSLTDTNAAVARLRGEVLALRSVVLILLGRSPDDVREVVIKTLETMRHLADELNADAAGPGSDEETTHQANLAARDMLRAIEATTVKLKP